MQIGSAENIELTPVELYQFIVSDESLQHEVLRVSQDFVPDIDSLFKAIFTLGSSTVKDITLDIIESTRTEGEVVTFSNL